MATAIGIVGKSKTGKTTLIEKLISELKSRGYKVATIKHTLHQVDLDMPGTDTWRHINAGSEASVLISPDSIMMIKHTNEQINLETAIKILGNEYDIILVEGFKNSQLPKIEVHRQEKGDLLHDLNNLIAIATDEKVDSNVIQIPLDNINAIAGLIEETIQHK